jgi:hypothetical protein
MADWPTSTPTETSNARTARLFSADRITNVAAHEMEQEIRPADGARSFHEWRGMTDGNRYAVDAKRRPYQC